MTDELQAPSIIEQMAADFYDAWSGKAVAVKWQDLQPCDRKRFIDAMIEAVKRVPDHCQIQDAAGTTTIIIGEGRHAFLQEHEVLTKNRSPPVT